jgi:hypothetical protein
MSQTVQKLNESGEPRHFIESFGGKFVEILEVWESFKGWYWFVTDYPKNPDKEEAPTGFDHDEVFGKVFGFENEWGYIYLPELRDRKKSHKDVWEVPKSNWFSISHVKTVYSGEVLPNIQKGNV